MPKTKWRTVSCTDDSLRSHSSQQAACDWISGREPGAQFRVQFDEGRGGGWQEAARVTAVKHGWTKEERTV
jgi:hypothetical protein